MQVIEGLASNTEEPLFKSPALYWSQASPHGEDDWSPTGSLGLGSLLGTAGPTFLVIQKANDKPSSTINGITLGRLESNDIVVSGVSISRFHAWFHHEAADGHWYLHDTNSKCGTYVNDERLWGGSARLNDRCLVRFGHVEMTFLLGLTADALVRQMWSAS